MVPDVLPDCHGEYVWIMGGHTSQFYLGLDIYVVYIFVEVLFIHELLWGNSDVSSYQCGVGCVHFK